MTSIARRLGCAVLALLSTAALAQESDGTTTTRAQRDADNPLRLILEAGKLKPRTKGEEPDPAAKPAVEAKAAPPKAALAKPAAARSVQVATLTDVAVPVVEPVTDLAPAPVETITFVPPAPYNPDDYFGVPPPVKGKLAAPARPASAVESKASLPAAAGELPPRATLKLADYVEPVLPERARRRLQADGEVVLDFTVNPDGSVSNLAVRSASDKALEQVAIDAVRQWRYQPIASAQAHGVQLVFKMGE